MFRLALEQPKTTWMQRQTGRLVEQKAGNDIYPQCNLIFRTQTDTTLESVQFISKQETPGNTTVKHNENNHHDNHTDQ